MVSLNLAAKIAACSTHHQHHHAVFLIRAVSIVACGYNHGYCHAEKVALGKVWPNRRKNISLWSFRFTKAGSLGMAKPCDACMELIKASGIHTVHYSTVTGMVKLKV